MTPGSPAESAGLVEGDILLAIDDVELSDLRGFSQILKAHAPGDRIRIKLRRGDQERTVEVVLKAR